MNCPLCQKRFILNNRTDLVFTSDILVGDDPNNTFLIKGILDIQSLNSPMS